MDNQAQKIRQILDARSLPPSSDFHDTKILFIDLQDQDRRHWADQLTNLSPDWGILEAKDGQTGLQLSRTEHVDCIVLELDLPDKTGLSLLLSLIPRRQHPDSAVVILTSTALEPLFPLAVSHGAYCCSVKNRMSVQDLDRAIRKAIASVDPNKNGHRQDFS